MASSTNGGGQLLHRGNVDREYDECAAEFRRTLTLISLVSSAAALLVWLYAAPPTFLGSTVTMALTFATTFVLASMIAARRFL